MRAVIVSDSQSISFKIRQLLLHNGLECQAGDVLPLHRAAEHIAHSTPDLVIVTMSPDQERALIALSEVRLLTQARLLAVGPALDSRLVLRTLRTGANDYLDEDELDVELPSALGRLQTESPIQTEPARTIAVLAPSGGSGSSTLAVNVAAVLAREHKSVLLLDLKLESGDLAALLNLKPTHTLADLCQNVARMDRTMFERALARHSSGVSLLAPPRNLADINLVTADGIRQALTLGRGLFPYVVVDMDHSFREEQIQVLRQANIILLVMRLDFTSLQNTQRTLEYLTSHLGIASDRLRVVVNRYGQPREVPALKAEQALGVKISHYVPEDPKTVNRSNNNGVPAVLEYPRARISKSVAKLAFSVNGRHTHH
jgi:pilus assembly protein CpaE